MSIVKNVILLCDGGMGCVVSTISKQIKGSEALNELILDLYGEDNAYKENEIRTFTINTITIQMNQS